MRKVKALAVKAGKHSKKHTGSRKGRQPAFKHFPVKRTINLAEIGEKPIDVKLAVPGIVLVILAALLFSKFAVADRLAAVSKAEQEAAVVREQLDAGYQKIEEFGEMTEEYAHLTYSGMTVEELERTDRIEVLNLVQRVVLPQAVVSSWSIQGNQVTLIVKGSTLQKVNMIVQQLEAEDMVDFCTVTTAATNETVTGNAEETSINEVVTAQVTIYLNNGLEEVE